MTRTQHRLTKHEMKEDSFVTFAFRAQEYIQSNQKTLLLALGGLVVAVVGVWLYSSASGRSQAEADALLTSAYTRVQQNDMEGAATIYREIKDQYQGTPAAREALFYLANLQFVAEQWTDAITQYEAYLEDYSSFDPGRNLAARAAIGDAAQALGDHTKALESYERALGLSGADYLKPDVYLSAARSALALGQNDKAVALADQLYETDGTSAVMGQMRELLALHGLRYLRGF